MPLGELVANCPSQDKLRQLLSGELKSDDSQSLELHVETCAVCQETIAILSGGGQTQAWNQSDRVPSGDDATGSFQPGESKRPPQETALDEILRIGLRSRALRLQESIAQANSKRTGRAPIRFRKCPPPPCSTPRFRLGRLTYLSVPKCR